MNNGMYGFPSPITSGFKAEFSVNPGNPSLVIPVNGGLSVYRIRVIDAKPSANCAMQLRISQDGGASFVSAASSYRWAAATVLPGGYATLNSAADTKIELQFNQSPDNLVLATASHPYSAEITIVEPGRPDLTKQITGTSTYTRVTGSALAVSPFLGDFILNKNPITHIQIFPSTGTLGARALLFAE